MRRTPSTRQLRRSLILARNISCASATMRWCLASDCREWCGHGPVLEVDISLANLALDLVGQATLLLNEAGDGDRARVPPRRARLSQLPAGRAAERRFRADDRAAPALHDLAAHAARSGCTQSSDKFLSEFAHKAVKEVAYHRELATEWTIRLGDGTEESARRMAEGLDWSWRFVPELFEVDEPLQAAIDRGIAPDPRAFEEEYRSAIACRAGRSAAGTSPPTSARSSAAGAATTASISGTCSPSCSSCRAPIPTRPGNVASASTR